MQGQRERQGSQRDSDCEFGPQMPARGNEQPQQGGEREPDTHQRGRPLSAVLERDPEGQRREKTE